MVQALPAVASTAFSSAGSSLLTAASLASTAVGTVAKFQQNKFQQKMLEQQAKVAEENAARERFAGQIDQQERDFVALQEMDARVARQAASGLSLQSSSFRRRRRTDRVLARKDALRIRNEAEVRATNFENQAASRRAEADMAGSAATFSLFEGVLGAGQDLITGAEFVNRQTARKTRRDGLEI